MSQHASISTPQVPHGELSSPRTRYSEGPEVYNALPPPQQLHKQYMGSSEQPTAPQTPPTTKEKRIMGLRRSTFSLLTILLVVVIVAAVGGGVGGALAVQNAKSKANSASQSTASATSSAPVLSTVTSLPSSTTAATNAVYTPPPPNNVARVDSTCPGGDLNAAIPGNQAGTYSCAAGTDYPGNDVIGTVAYTLQQCAEACSWYNIAQVSTSVAKCRGAVFSGLLGKYYNDRRANCFLKTNMGSGIVSTDWTALRLR